MAHPATHSRLRKSVATVFDVFAEVAAPQSDVLQSEGAWILWKYPDDYADERMMTTIAEFSFPCGVATTSTATGEPVQKFMFVLTDADGNYTFGYCRHTPSSNTCICIVSALPWTNVFYQVLEHVATTMNNYTEKEVEALLVRTYHQTIPEPGETLVLEQELGKNKLEVQCPDHSKLPVTAQNQCLSDYYQLVEERQMIAVYCSLLRERRVIVTGRKLSQLSSCVMAAATLIEPLHWQHIFVPVLPRHLYGYLSAPMPFLIGVPKDNLESARREVDLHEVVILDIDDKTFSSSYSDVEDTPSEAVFLSRVIPGLDLMTALRQELHQGGLLLGDGLARAFLRATVVLFGGYRRGLTRRDGAGKIDFDPDRFVAEQKPSLRTYLAGTRHLQIFSQFIDDRLNSLNGGEAIVDDFEQEARIYEHRPKQTAQMMKEMSREAITGIQGRVQKIMPKDLSSLGGSSGGSNSNLSAYGASLLQETKERFKSVKLGGSSPGVPAGERFSRARRIAKNTRSSPNPFNRIEDKWGVTDSDIEPASEANETAPTIRTYKLLSDTKSMENEADDAGLVLESLKRTPERYTASDQPFPMMTRSTSKSLTDLLSSPPTGLRSSNPPTANGSTSIIQTDLIDLGPPPLPKVNLDDIELDPLLVRQFPRTPSGEMIEKQTLPLAPPGGRGSKQSSPSKVTVGGNVNSNSNLALLNEVLGGGTQSALDDPFSIVERQLVTPRMSNSDGGLAVKHKWETFEE